MLKMIFHTTTASFFQRAAFTRATHNASVNGDAKILAVQFKIMVVFFVAGTKYMENERMFRLSIV